MFIFLAGKKIYVAVCQNMLFLNYDLDQKTVLKSTF